MASYNISTGVFNDNLFIHSTSDVDFQYFIYNNNLYIKNAQNQFYITNGLSIPVLSSMPNFYQNGSNFAFNSEYPYVGGGAEPYVEYNGNLYGKDLGLDSSYPKKIWKTNGTTLELISDQLDLFSAKIHNGNLYAFGYNYVSNNYYYPKIVKFNNLTNVFDEVWSFPDTGYGTFSSHLFFQNNNLFVTASNGNSMPLSLYKIDLSTLSNSEFQQKENITFSPNPAQSQITFSQEITTLEVFDITGKKVQSFENTSTTFDVSNLESGMYLLKAKTTQGNIFTEKLVKE